MMTDTDEEVTSKPVKEVPVVRDQGFFKHTTGDTYDGFFEAKKKDKSVKMTGPGVYTTNEGDTYSGTWESDRLVTTEDITVTFHDGSKYEGLFKDWSYNGHGKYTYPDGSILTCAFIDNTPIANLTLVDPNGHTWLGKADQGFGWFDPVNHYYELLEKTREGSKIRRKHKEAKAALSAVGEKPPDIAVETSKTKAGKAKKQK